MFIFLDESGILTKNQDNYFIVATYSVTSPQEVVKAFKKWQKTKYPKKLRGQAELKFKDSHITDDLRLKTLQHLARQKIQIFYTYLKKKNIPQIFYKKGKIAKTGLLYTEVIKATLQLYLPTVDNQFIVIRDNYSLKGMTAHNFNETLRTDLVPQLPAKVLFKVQAVDSTSHPLIQVADWVYGGLARYYERKTMGERFYTAIKGSIVRGKELFSEEQKRA